MKESFRVFLKTSSNVLITRFLSYTAFCFNLALYNFRIHFALLYMLVYLLFQFSTLYNR